MEPFYIKPGERVVGLGIDFATRLGRGEKISSVAAVASAGLNVTATSFEGTEAYATIACSVDQADGFGDVEFTVTGDGGSIRKGRRILAIQSDSI